MALLKRYLISAAAVCPRFVFALVSVWAWAIFVSDARGQSTSEQPKAFRTLAISSEAQGIFYDLRGKPVSVTATDAGLSPSYEVPSGGRIVFYRLQPAETASEKPHRINIAEVEMNGVGPFLVFMAAKPESPGEYFVQVAEDSWATHPVETIRLFNFSRRNLVVRIVIKDVVVELAPSQDRVLPYVAGGQFWLQVATKEPEGWVMRVSAPQIAPPKARISAIMFDQAPSINRPATRELQLVKFIDVAPQPVVP